MILEDIQKVYELAISYIGNGRYFVFAAAAMLFFYVTEKKNRPRLIYPILVVAFVIGTPWLYHFVFNRDAYWRTFWMLPQAILISLFCVKLIQICGTFRERIGITVFLILLLLFVGTDIYSAKRVRPSGRKESIFQETANPEKVSAGAQQVADLLLTLEKNPKVISRMKYTYELRQYSSKIKLYYGRDIEGFIIPVTEKKGWRKEVRKQLESSSPNYYRVLQIADGTGYNFVITSSAYRIEEKILERYGYREIAILDESAVYYKEHPEGSADNQAEDVQSDGDSVPEVLNEQEAENLLESLGKSGPATGMAETDGASEDVLTQSSDMGDSLG